MILIELVESIIFILLQENRSLIVAYSLTEGENKTFKTLFHVHDIIKTKVGISSGLSIL